MSDRYLYSWEWTSLVVSVGYISNTLDASPGLVDGLKIVSRYGNENDAVVSAALVKL